MGSWTRDRAVRDVVAVALGGAFFYGIVVGGGVAFAVAFFVRIVESTAGTFEYGWGLPSWRTVGATIFAYLGSGAGLLGAVVRLNGPRRRNIRSLGGHEDWTPRRFDPADPDLQRHFVDEPKVNS